MNYKTFTSAGEASTELRLFPNVEDRLFIEISVPGEDVYGHGFIVLNKEDAEELIEEIKKSIPFLK